MDHDALFDMNTKASFAKKFLARDIDHRIQ